ncbi:MAG: DNA/RNA nuclease SfsA [Oscillospiraceae bacterium]|nr:DNA/RNA nuclease SfsA [Oscillospiraceae bacterium]
MQYRDIVTGTFLRRPNRFIAHVEIAGQEVICHVKNTGRCRELLVPGAKLVLECANTPGRKTPYSVIGVYKEGRLVNMDAQAPNKAANEWLMAGSLPGFPAPTLIRPEAVFGGSRFDFYLEQDDRRAYLEVKGVTLERDGAAYFPDAPTERGVKHLRHLTACLAAGFEAYVLFVIQMTDVTYFSPNDEIHPAFGEALRTAADAGVGVLAFDCAVKPDSMVIQQSVEVRL